MFRSFRLMLCMVATVNSQLRPNELHDRMGRTDKTKMLYIASDVMRDTYLKMRQIFEIRDEHEPFIAFNVGIIIGKIREKYRLMIETYKEAWDKYKGRTTFFGPGLITLRSVHYVISMEMVHHLEIEIEKYVEILQKMAEADRNSTNMLVPLSVKSLRTGVIEESNVDEEEIKKKANEEVEKSMLREGYLMKKLGLPPNITTTKKRFMKQWPVEDTWSLEHAYS